MCLYDLFVSFVEYHFKDLESKYGFRIMSTQVPFVIYESESFIIFIYYEAGNRYEVDLTIEEKQTQINTHSIHISDLVKDKKIIKKMEQEWLLVNTDEKLERVVKELSLLFHKVGLKYIDKRIKRMNDK